MAGNDLEMRRLTHAIQNSNVDGFETGSHPSLITFDKFSIPNIKSTSRGVWAFRASIRHLKTFADSLKASCDAVSDESRCVSVEL